MKNILLPVLLLAVWMGAYAQTSPVSTGAPILQVYESRRFDKNNPDKNVLKNGDIAEINSQLLLRINKEEIRNRMLLQSGVVPAELGLVSKYKFILQIKTELMEEIQEGLDYTRSGAAPDFSQLAELSEGIADFTDTLLSDAFLKNEAVKAYAEFADKQNSGALPSCYNEDLYLLEYFARIAADALERIENAQTLKFILAGSIRTEKSGVRPIHLSDEFDSNPSKEYIVPQWVLTLNDDQKQELRDVAALADKLGSLKQNNSKKAKEAYYDLLNARYCLDTLKKELDVLPILAKKLGSTVETQTLEIVKPLQDQLKFILNRYLKVPAAAANLGSADQLVGFYDNLNTLNELVGSLYDNLPAILDNLDEKLQKTDEVNLILSLRDYCLGTIRQDIRQSMTLYQTLQMLLVGNKQDLRFQAIITDKVKRLGYNDIPEESLMDLTKTGPRQNGDAITLQAFIQQDTGAGSPKPQTVFQEVINLHQIALYSEVKVSMILARPDPLLQDQKRKFLFAPSYSVLFRWGSRRSKFYNDFLNFGIGFNFAAPDFNLDGVPEFAVGMTFSTFKDMLSVGYGYNFGLDARYYFVGFRLPFASASLPIFNSIEK